VTGSRLDDRAFAFTGRYLTSLAVGLAVLAYVWAAHLILGGPPPEPHGLRLAHRTAIDHASTRTRWRDL